MEQRFEGSIPFCYNKTSCSHLLTYQGSLLRGENECEQQ